MDAKKIIEDYIDENAEKFLAVSDAIWEYAEGGYHETKSAALL